MKKCSIIVLLLLCANIFYAQRITVNTNQTPTQLIENILLNSGVCSSVTNVRTSVGVATTGVNSPYGSYTQNGTNNLFTQGMILSTGFATRAGNTTISTTLSDNIGSGGDTDLATAFSIVAPAVLSDAAYIEFDFTPIRNSISFKYFLASEEYEYNKNYPCQFSDAFAFLIKDNTTGGVYQNIALIPGTTTPVGILSIHPNLSNLTGGCPASNPTLFNGYNQNPPNIDGTNFSGSTKALVATSSVVPGHTYHIKMVIADYGSASSNRLYDSAVFLEAGSFDLSGFITDSNNVVLTGSTTSCTLVANSQILNPVYQWYKDGVAIPAPQGTTATYTIPTGDSGVYKVTVIDSVSSCADTIAPITVVALSPPTVTNPQTLCVGATLANLTATGSNLNWYTSASGGTRLASNIILISGTYYVSQTVGMCESIRISLVVIIGNPTPIFSSVPAICSGNTIAPLPTTSNNSISGTWLPAINNSITTTYTFTPNANQCGTVTTLTITVNPNMTPTFNSVNPICYGNAFAALPTTSNNGVLGAWSPAPNNTTTTTYTFTPNTGQCSVSNNLTVVINPLATLALTSSGASTNQTLCNSSAIIPIIYTFGGAATSATVTGLPVGVAATTFGNTITISGSPTTTVGSPFNYTITTSGGTCGSPSSSGRITVNPNVTPTFSIAPALCSGGIAPILPSTSLNNITGTWSPSIVNNTTSQQYSFTPVTTATCATNFTLNITVQNNFDFTIEGICVGKNFELQIKPLANLNLNTATINWLNTATNTGFTTSNFNATQYLYSQSTTTLPISFTATITDNAGCFRSHFYSVNDLYCDIQRGISPNGDKLNDFFDLINLNVKKLIIYNRNGMEVFSKEQYTNEWIGQTNSGSELPDGTYYYVIDFNNQSETKTGWIYINREH